ncbi:MAG: 2,3-bisphosphoglycerate-independent phosphoglycerate mutase [Clostridia bacterium]|nr:2,3-bisphosphoglycerate-independent phosphoglycerate mutase [Clostridia bacterium]
MRKRKIERVNKRKLTALIIMDGVGIPKDIEKSGITPENTVELQKLKDEFSNTTLFASEEYVGLPMGQAGTSEVGHMTIGDGRVNFQPLVKINKEIESGAFFKNKELNDAIDYAVNNHKNIHLLGLTSDGGVHSHIEHLFALLELCKKRKFFDVFIHFVSDGRDTEPKSVKRYLEQVQNYIKLVGCGSLASIVGRFYAFDRDKNYDRNKLAYDLWVRGKGEIFENYNQAIDKAYKAGETDEFIKPIVLLNKNKQVTEIKQGDVVISYNFRADRERQLTYIMAEDNDLDFVEKLNLYFVTMTEYDETFKNVHVVFENQSHDKILSQVLSENGVKQVKIAETEKYAHLTFFFNSGKQDTFENEERILIDSKKMASYASCPEMSAEKIADKAVEVMDKYDFIAINFANCDMVGHSGDKMATRKAMQVVDVCVKKVVDEVLKRGGQGIVTADHGNADIMEYDDHSPHTSHTISKVPLILFGREKMKLKENGTLADIAPTLLKLMSIQIPSEMTGKPLF